MTPWETAQLTTEIVDQRLLEESNIPTSFSSEYYYDILRSAQSRLVSQDLTASNFENPEAQLNSERLRKITSRRSVQSGGGLKAGELKKKSFWNATQKKRSLTFKKPRKSPDSY
ncbi:hypothetical protein K3495_g547 [Podosphaera aphanis]|nr:hypothetical protein K3495_g547 [Podosphaera aphanis]